MQAKMQKDEENESILKRLPEEIRRIVNGLLYEKDNRNLASTQTFEYARRKDIPVRERYCIKEIKDIGYETPSNYIPKIPIIRNQNYSQQNALVKAILIRALESQTLFFDINRQNFQYFLTNFRTALICVLKNINKIKILSNQSGTNVNVHDLAWIIRTINDNNFETTLDLMDLPDNYFIYNLNSQYGQELRLPQVCKIIVLCKPSIFKQWSETKVLDTFEEDPDVASTSSNIQGRTKQIARTNQGGRRKQTARKSAKTKKTTS